VTYSGPEVGFEEIIHWSSPKPVSGPRGWSAEGFPDYFRIANCPGVIALWLGPRCRVLPYRPERCRV